jgi:TIGR03009 family protein
MDQTTRTLRAIVIFCWPSIWVVSNAGGQQLGPPQPYPQQQAYTQQAQPPAQVQQQPASQPQRAAQPPAPVAPQMPPGFPLNPLQQAALDQALDAWQTESGKIATFSCEFDRHEYVIAFGPVINNQLQPLNKNKGELTYSKPDKGSFQIKEVWTYTEQPAPAGQPQAPKRGDWIKKPDAIGEHWVCDGKSIYEFRSDQKVVKEIPLPPRKPGETILDGPLPFLFGAESAKLKQRYWIKIDERNNDPNQIWLNSWPKFQDQAADFRQVDVILDRNRQLPRAMQVTRPNGDRHVYVFHIDKASINGTFDRVQQALFKRPATPWGWKHVVENVPMAQGPEQPGPQTR